MKRSTVKLIGTDGNVYSIIGLTVRAIAREYGSAKAQEFKTRAFAMHSYDAVLQLVMEYCDVE